MFPRINRTAFIILSFTWGLPLTIFGALMALVLLLLGKKPERCGWSVGFRAGGKNWGGIEGGFFFVCDEREGGAIAAHEFGHAIQNCVFGPLMIPLVTLPSAVRYWIRRARSARGRAQEKSYDAIWFERQATRLGRSYCERIAREGGDGGRA